MHKTIFAVALAIPLAAQKLPAPVDNAREIQVYDARAVLDAIGSVRGKFVDVPALGNEPETPEVLALHRRDRLEDVVAFLRTALAAQLTDPGDLQRLGLDLLVLRGSPAQQIAVQRYLRTWPETATAGITVTTRIARVPGAVFDESIAPILGLRHPAEPGRRSAPGTTIDDVLLPERDPILGHHGRGGVVALATNRETCKQRNVPEPRAPSRSVCSTL